MDKELKKSNVGYRNCYSRAAPLKLATIDVDNRTVTGVIATERAVIVTDWYNWRTIREVLLVDGMDYPDRLPLLKNHSRFEISDIAGSVTGIYRTSVDDIGDVLMGTYHFSSTASIEWTLAIEGHLTSTSIGYEVYPEHSVELKPGESREVNGKIYTNDFDDKLPLVIRLKSKIFENSLVPIGADDAAKFRSFFEVERVTDIKTDKEENKTDKEEINNIKLTLKGDKKVEERNQEQIRIDAITNLAKHFDGKVEGVNLQDMAALYINGGKSEKEFADMIMDRQKASASFGAPRITLSEKEAKEFSIVRGLRSLYRGQRSLEVELSEEYARQTGATSKGLLVPYDALMPKMQRDLQATGAGKGIDFVPTEKLSDMFINFLYEKLVLDNITLLPNRKGNVEIPALSGSAGFGWAATENAALSENDPATTVRTASPKRGGRFIDVSKQLLLQSDPNAEQIFVGDLIRAISGGIQQAILNGSGTSGQPRGVKNTSGIGAVGSLASYTWADFVRFETLIDDNFSDDKSMYFVTRRSHRGTLKSAPKVAGQPVYICENNMVNGYEVRTTNLVTSGDVFFGDWSQVIVPMWDAIDLVIDPYTQAPSGLVRITASQLLDVIVRYPSAFSLGTGFPA